MECKYCKLDPEESIPISKKQTPFFDRTLTFDVYCNDYKKSIDIGLRTEYGAILFERVNINFCPMCGRKLKETQH